MPDALTATDDVHHVDDSALRAFFGYRMKRSFNVIQADLALALKPFELRMLTFTALTLVVSNPGLRQSQLAEAMDVERPNLVTIVEELVRRDLISKERVPTDRRAYSLQATRQGRMLCAEATTAVTAHEEALLGGLDEEMRAGAIEAMNRIEQGRQRG
ncbi:MarR family winged helix-turn-helix transcriptional regulator [Tropicimonas sediminicola]|uniref:DNA-binding transcriptional regulator, MarR family n=1 Tax=Tropicimonas sediminicola TaxID=1031541 RepID=A0A239FDV5_9RHOB|nr:MarR family transcriptional regulator [Tropicimonas sediminicola]SNS54332.1 DNA-binding transcriptional regulator, MarR family [Tropicimonas sediminicola]